VTGPDLDAVRPTPTEEEAVAIAAALTLVLGSGAAASAGPEAPPPGPPRWRFSGRWWSKPVASRRDRPVAV
jgi:hypothetical protein